MKKIVRERIQMQLRRIEIERRLRIRPESPESGYASSCVSFESDWSKEDGINFKRVSDKKTRPDSPEPGYASSCVSFESDWSKEDGINFKRVSDKQNRPESPEPGYASSCMSFESDWSKEDGINFKRVSDKKVEPAGVRWLKPVLRKYSCELTLDTNTLNRQLKLSDNNRKVTLVEEDQPYPDHPERFDYWPQLLCRDGLTGRCYWEVERRGDVVISVSYRGIRRRGDSDDCVFGYNDHSWRLFCSDDGFSVWHNNRQIFISSSVSGRVAVYVDCPAGSLSFYRVSSDSLIHLHTVNTTFTQPLYPGFGFRFWSPGSSVSLCSV